MKKPMAFGLLLASSALLFPRKNQRIPLREKSIARRNRLTADQAARRYIIYAILPAWSLAGFLDWVWHRQTKIATTSGVEESVTHLLMMIEEFRSFSDSEENQYCQDAFSRGCGASISLSNCSLTLSAIRGTSSGGTS
jgi:hypothetical protein